MTQISRRTLLGAGAALAATGFTMINTGAYAAAAASTKLYSTRVMDLVKGSLIIDMLGLISLNQKRIPFSRTLTEEQMADFRQSGITSFHVSTGIGGPEAYSEVLKFMLEWAGFVGRNSQMFDLISTGADLDRVKEANRIGVIQGLQNSTHFRTVEDVQMFYGLGQRVSQLTYNSQNLIGAGCTEIVDGGLSEYGVSIVQAMNDTGMLVDTSHCGDKTTLDAIAASAGPIAFTHSNCRALNNHPRTKTDEAIKALAAKGGVMGITGVRMFVSAKEPTTIGDLVDHIDHVVQLVGIDHVGIGTDADLYGYDQMDPAEYESMKAGYHGKYNFRDKIDIEAFSGPMKMYNLVDELVKRGYSDSNIQAVLGGNFRRLLGSVWK